MSYGKKGLLSSDWKDVNSVDLPSLPGYPPDAPTLPTTLYAYAPSAIPTTQDPNPFFEPLRNETISGPVSGSWGEVKESGRIKMTPWSHRLTEVTFPVFSVADEPVAESATTFDIFDSDAGDGYRMHGITSAGGYYVTGSYYQLPLYRSAFPNVPHYQILADEGEIQRYAEDVKGKVVSSNLTSLDALTELSELPETLKLVGSLIKGVLHPLRAYKHIRERLLTKPSKAHLDELAGRWLQLQYGILPVVYTINDLLELMEKIGDIYLTSRSRKDLTYAESNIPWDKPDNYLYDVGTIEVILRGTGRARFGPKGVDSSQIGFNPAKTLWEEIPFSLVVDWFANVTEWIVSNTSDLYDTAKERKFCLSTKMEYNVDTYLHIGQNLNVTYTKPFSYKEIWNPITDAPIPPQGWLGDQIQVHTQSVDLNYLNSDHLTKVVKKEYYDRVLFNPTDVQLTFAPELQDFSRLLSAGALGYTALSKALRRLL